MVEGSTILKSVNRFLQRGGDGSTKDTDHPIRHPCGHLGHRPCAQGTRGCAWRDDQCGRGQNTVLGWSDPTFADGSVAKVMIGVAPAHEILFDVLPAGAAGFWRKPVRMKLTQVTQVKIAVYTFITTNFFNRCSACGIGSQAFATTASAKVAAQIRSNRHFAPTRIARPRREAREFFRHHV